MSTANHASPRPVAGIDVSKGCLDVCLLPDGGTFCVANDQRGIDELAGRLGEARPE